MPHAAMSDTGALARCALNKTEGPLSWSQGPHYGTLVGTVTGTAAARAGGGRADLRSRTERKKAARDMTEDFRRIVEGNF
jgi:hypothetical protein